MAGCGAGATIRRDAARCVLSADGENSPITQARVGALRNGLEALGWIEGRNLQSLSEGVAVSPTVCASSRRSWWDCRRILRTVGIETSSRGDSTNSDRVVLVLDPVRDSYVASVAKPGGNLTAFASYDPAISGKYLQLLKEIAQNVTPRNCYLRPGQHRNDRLDRQSLQPRRPHLASTSRRFPCATPPTLSKASKHLSEHLIVDCSWHRTLRPIESLD